MGKLSTNGSSDHQDDGHEKSITIHEPELSVKMVQSGELSTTSAERDRNPYTPGKPVDSPLMFFGRESELLAIGDRITNGIHTAVVGPPDIGTSSLLRQVAQNREPENLRVAYIDLTDDPMLNPDRLARMLWSQWWGQIRSGYVPEISGMVVLDPLARRLAAAGHRLVAILDGYEQILWHRSLFETGFHDQLELLVKEGVITLVTGSHEPLAELYQQAGSSSGLFSYLVQHDLGLLTESDAMRLLTVPIKRARYGLTESDGRYLVELAGPHPLFLQIMGAYLFTALESNRFDRNQLETQFKAAAEPLWQDLWQSLPPRARTGISAKAMKIDSDIDNRLIRGLHRKGIVQGEGSDTKLFSRGFAEWVSRMQAASQAATMDQREVASS